MKKLIKTGSLLLIFLLPQYILAQTPIQEKDTLPVKVHHAEPLYVDLVRDLGARKGEAEWNVAFGTLDHHDVNQHQMLVEYEFAPIDRLGVEFEVPFTYYPSVAKSDAPESSQTGIEGIKVAAQYTFLVAEKAATSMAIGYIHEFSLSEFAAMPDKLIKGEYHNPFLVIAKRWGTYLHTMVNAGPEIDHDFGENWYSGWNQNFSIHFMMPTTTDFVGMELNQEFRGGEAITILRPQMRLALSDHLKIGILASIPVHQPGEGMGFFTRLILEP